LVRTLKGYLTGHQSYVSMDKFLLGHQPNKPQIFIVWPMASARDTTNLTVLFTRLVGDASWLVRKLVTHKVKLICRGLKTNPLASHFRPKSHQIPNLAKNLTPQLFVRRRAEGRIVVRQWCHMTRKMRRQSRCKAQLGFSRSWHSLVNVYLVTGHFLVQTALPKSAS
jgi:hypothetical protein